MYVMYLPCHVLQGFTVCDWCGLWQLGDGCWTSGFRLHPGANCPVAFCLFSIGNSAWITAESVTCSGATNGAGFVLLLVELCDKDALTAHDMWVIIHHGWAF